MMWVFEHMYRTAGSLRITNSYLADLYAGEIKRLSKLDSQAHDVMLGWIRVDCMGASWRLGILLAGLSYFPLPTPANQSHHLHRRRHQCITS